MVIQESPLQDITATQPAQPTPSGSSAPSPETITLAAIAPAHNFASTLPANFTPTSILIEIFGSLALPGIADSMAAGLLLGLAGIQPEFFTPGRIAPENIPTFLQAIHTASALHLNGSIEVPYIAVEHLVLHPTGLLPSHPDGVRLTAYHCVHPFVTRQYIASTGTPLGFTEC